MTVLDEANAFIGHAEEVDEGYETTMRRNAFVAGWEAGFTKACEWIESYLFDIGFPDDWCRDSTTMKSGKQKFLEAMEE